MSQEVENDVVKVDAVEVLKAVGRGKLMYDISKKIEEVVKGVQESAKAGKITIELKITPATRNDAHTVIVEHKVDGKAPRADEAGTLFFTTRAHGLSRNDEDQGEFQM